jgi:hypothetical protein
MMPNKQHSPLLKFELVYKVRKIRKKKQKSDFKVKFNDKDYERA